MEDKKIFFQDKFPKSTEFKKIFRLFNLTQELLEEDSNLTRHGMLKKEKLLTIQSILIELFEEDITKLRNQAKNDEK